MSTDSIFKKRDIAKDGDPERLFFLPVVLNELGPYICRFVRNVYSQKHKKSVVIAVKKGHEALFPNVDSFFYDWDDSVEVNKRTRDGTKYFRELCDRQWLKDNFFPKVLQHILDNYSEYKDYTFLYPFTKIIEPDHPNHFIHFDVVEKRTSNISADVVIIPRFKRYANQPPIIYQQMCDVLKKYGYSVGAVGTKEMSYNLDFDVKSWDYHQIAYDLDPDIELIRKAKFVVATNCGMLHLAILMKKDVLFMRDRGGYGWFLVRQVHPNTYFDLLNEKSLLITKKGFNQKILEKAIDKYRSGQFYNYFEDFIAGENPNHENSRKEFWYK